VQGVSLGKAVEEWDKQLIECYPREMQSYPLKNYFPTPLNSIWKDRMHTQAEGTLLGSIHHMVRDDDIDYTILNLYYRRIWFKFDLTRYSERVAYSSIIYTSLPC